MVGDSPLENTRLWEDGRTGPESLRWSEQPLESPRRTLDQILPPSPWP